MINEAINEVLKALTTKSKGQNMTRDEHIEKFELNLLEDHQLGGQERAHYHYIQS